MANTLVTLPGGGIPLQRGARPSPRHKLCSAPAHVPASPPPPVFGVIPSKLDMWGNSQYGDCVTAEEAFAIAAYSTMAGQTESFVTAQDVVNWAWKHGFLNGAMLTDVMDAMAKYGLTSGGVTYKDGPYSSVDWTNDTVLSSAITNGPVKIGVAADQLQNCGAGQKMGWFGVNFQPDNNIDHCVSLAGFGTVTDCAKLLNVGVPSGVDGTQRGYLLFTWDTIGVITQNSMKAITAEAWLRNPTTLGVIIPTPTPTPTPTPPPPPPPPPTQGVIQTSADLDHKKVSIVLPQGWTM